MMSPSPAPPFAEWASICAQVEVPTHIIQGTAALSHSCFCGEVRGITSSRRQSKYKPVVKVEGNPNTNMWTTMQVKVPSHVIQGTANFNAINSVPRRLCAEPSQMQGESQSEYTALKKSTYTHASHPTRARTCTL